MAEALAVAVSYDVDVGVTSDQAGGEVLDMAVAVGQAVAVDKALAVVSLPSNHIPKDAGHLPADF